MARAESEPGQEALRIEVVYSPRAGVVEHAALELPPGSTLQQALEATGWLRSHPEIATLPAGVWGRVQPPDTPLRDRDRVEFYRPLLVDPKEARRQRYKRQRAAKTLSGSPTR